MPLIGQEAERRSEDCYPLTDVGVAVWVLFILANEHRRLGETCKRIIWI